MLEALAVWFFTTFTFTVGEGNIDPQLEVKARELCAQVLLADPGEQAEEAYRRCVEANEEWQSAEPERTVRELLWNSINGVLFA